MTSNQSKPTLKRPFAFTRACRVPSLIAVFFLWSAAAFAQAQGDNRSPINAAIAQEAVMALLSEVPEDVGLAPENYISGNDQTAGTRLVQVQIGAEGEIIPSADWRNFHPQYCSKQARETTPAAQILEFEMYRTSENGNGVTRHQYYTFVRLQEAGSGIIKHQAEGSSTVGQASAARGALKENPDFDGLPQALSEALGNLGISIGTPEDGCGDIRLKHEAGNTVDDEFVFVAGYQNKSGPNVEYDWDFGDGSTNGSNDQLGRHVFAEKGTYTVTVHVSGEGVREGSASIDVVVENEEEDEPIQARDGTWAIELVSQDMQGCSPQIASRVKTATASMIGEKKLQTLEFEKPFHPEPLMQHAQPLEWKQAGINTWRTVIAEMGGSGMTQKVELEVKVISPVLINAVLDQQITMADSLAKLMGGSGRCLAVSDFELAWEQQ